MHSVWRAQRRVPLLWGQGLRASLVAAVLWALPPIAAGEWVPFSAQWGRFLGAADHQHLNRGPLGPADTLVVVGPHFHAVGRDGKAATADDQRVRLFGVNLSHEAAFPDPSRAAEVAATLRSMGFNAVRLHHMDTLPVDGPTPFRSTLTTGPYPSLHMPSIERLRTFIRALKQEGLYVNLNLMVGYAFRPGPDGVPATDATGRGPQYGSPVHLFHPRLVELQVQHAQQLIGALQLTGDPVLAQVEIVNESSLAAAWFHWDPDFWDREIAGPYRQELDRQWALWLRQRYGHPDRTCAAWGGCPPQGTALPTPADLAHAGAPAGGTAQTLWARATRLKDRVADRLGWTRPAAAGVNDLPPRSADFFRFLADTDRAFLLKMRAEVRRMTRADLPVTGSQVNFLGPLNLWSHRDMDYLDVHHYTDHPEFPGGGWSATDWRIRDAATSGEERDSWLALAHYRDRSKPFVVSEFNQPHPNRLGAEILPLMAAFARLQDWDGLYFFDYVDAHPQRATPHNFNLQGDWPKAAVTGLSARLFRVGDVAARPAAPAMVLDESMVLQAAYRWRAHDAWPRLHREVHRTDPRQALSQRFGFGGAPAVGGDAGALGPDTTTGGLQVLPGDRQMSLHSGQSWGFFGRWSAGQSAQLPGVRVTPQAGPGASTEERPLVVLAHSLDGRPLDRSLHWLLATPSPVTGTRPGSRPPEPQALVPYGPGWTLAPRVGTGDRSGPRDAESPLWMWRQALVVDVRHPGTQLQVYPLDANGRRLAPLPASHVVRSGDGWSLRLQHHPAATALWHEVVVSPSQPSANRP